jgi:hypothetical protein
MVTYSPSSTETDAERAWRYGETANKRYLSADGHVMFADGSSIYRGKVDTPRSLRHHYERMDATAARLGCRGETCCSAPAG